MKIIFLLISLLFLNNYTNAEDKLTDYVISAGVDFNGNFYNAKFKELPGIPNCCTEYQNTLGIGWSVHAGIEYLFENSFLRGNWRILLPLSFNNLSADFSRREFIANIIIGNNSYRGISEFRLQPTIYTLQLEPGIAYYPIVSLPLSITANFKAGYLIKKEFESEEELIEPAGVNFETGNRIRQQKSGEIPDAASLIFSASLGLRYEIYKIRNFSILPEVKYSYGFTDIVQSLDWKIHYAQAGIFVQYRVPEPPAPPVIPPAAPPMPQLPEPPSAKKLDIALYVNCNGNPVADNGICRVPVKVNEQTSRFSVLPVFFYKNPEEFEIPVYKHPRNEEEAQGLSFYAVIEHLRLNPGVNTKIIISGEESTDFNLLENKVKKYFSSIGIDDYRIINEKSVFTASDLKNEQLADEYANIRFEFSDGTKILSVPGDTVRQKSIGSVRLQVSPEISAGANPVIFSGKISSGNIDLSEFGSQGTAIEINTSNYEQIISFDGKVLIHCRLTDAEGKSKEAEKKVNIIPDEFTESWRENISSSPSDSVRFSQYTLGFFDFNSPEFSATDNYVLEITKNAIGEGKIVKILPLTDNIGTEAYNRNLAKQRADAASRLIGTKINVVYPDHFIFPNDNPHSRILNRSVLVRIQ